MIWMRKNFTNQQKQSKEWRNMGWRLGRKTKDSDEKYDWDIVRISKEIKR